MSKPSAMPCIAPGKPAKILICQQRQIGDVVLATPCIRLLAERFPGAELHFLTEKKCRPVLENNPRLTRIWTIDKGAGLPGAIRLYWGLAREQFDIVIDFQQLMRLRLAVLVSRAGIRLSYPSKWYDRLVYNVASPTLEGYATKAKSGVLNILGIEWNGEPSEIHLTADEDAWAREFMGQWGVTDGVPYVTVDPTHRRATRKWPEEHYAKLIRLLLGEFPQLRAFMLYGPGEKEDVERIRSLAGDPENCIISEHMTSIREMCAIQRNAAVHIGNCSAPRHTAAALGTPSVIISGATRPGSWRFPSPHHVNLYPGKDVCRWCNKNSCEREDIQCLWSVEPEQVLEQVKALLYVEATCDSDRRDVPEAR